MLAKYQTLLALGFVAALSGQSLAAPGGFSPVSAQANLFQTISQPLEMIREGALLPVSPAVGSAVAAPLLLAQSSITGSYDFTWSAIKQNGVIELSGNVPSDQIATFLDIRAGKNSIGQLSVGKGAPQAFISGSIAALDALKRLQDGFVTLEEGEWIVEGVAASAQDKEEIIDLLTHAVDAKNWSIMIFVAPDEEETSAPQITAQMSDLPYTWSARINEQGAFEIAGFVPSDGLKNFLDTRALNVAQDTSTVRPEAPAGYIKSAVAAIAALRQLGNGRVEMTGQDWSLSAEAQSQERLDDVLAGLKSSVDTAKWTFNLSVAPPEEAAEVAEGEGEEDLTSNEEDLAPNNAGDDAEQGNTEQAGTEQGAAGETATDTTGAEKAPQVLNPDYQFNALRAENGPITLSGMAPTRAFADYLARVVGAPSSQAIALENGAPQDFQISAMTGIRALSQLYSGLLAYENGSWTLVGDAMNAQVARQAGDMIGGLETGADWQVDIALLPVLQLCQQAVARFSDTHIILFAPASARLTAQSASDVAELAQDLNNCPEVAVYVAGHTDSDGPADANMALSVARAEAVIAQLVASGVDPMRLYAVGYGETLPIASNETRAGKAQNRRIVFELVQE